MKSLESELIDAGVGKFNGDIKKDEKVVHDNVKDVVKDIVVKNVGKKRALHCSWAFCVSLFVLLFIIAFGTIGSIRAALDHLRRDHEEFAVKSSSRENASFAAELSASSRMQLQAFVNRIAEGAVNEALSESFRNYSKMNDQSHLFESLMNISLHHGNDGGAAGSGGGGSGGSGDGDGDDGDNDDDNDSGGDHSIQQPLPASLHCPEGYFMSGVSRNGSAECHEQKFVQMTVGEGVDDEQDRVSCRCQILDERRLGCAAVQSAE